MTSGAAHETWAMAMHWQSEDDEPSSAMLAVKAGNICTGNHSRACVFPGKAPSCLGPHTHNTNGAVNVRAKIQEASGNPIILPLYAMKSLFQDIRTE